MTQPSSLPADRAGTVFDEPGGGALHPHIVPLRLLAGIFVALIALTVLTVAVTYVDLGGAGLWVAVAIAGVKALLVAAVFMHLAFDKGVYSLIFFGAILFVVLFIGLTLMDTTAYQPDLIKGYAPDIPQ